MTPRDVVDPTGLTGRTILALDAAAGQPVTVTEPGELLDSDDGPLGVGPATTGTFHMGRPTIAAADLEAAGLSPSDVPNLNIIDTKGTQ